MTRKKKSHELHVWDEYALNDVRDALKVCSTLSEICLFLGIENSLITRMAIKDVITRHKLPYIHLLDFEQKRRGRPPKWTVDEVFCKNSHAPRDVLLRMSTLFGLFEHKCSECGNTRWEGRPIPLEIHHINGDPSDNRIPNLKILCPNCHALTPNHAGKSNAGKPRPERKGMKYGSRRASND